MGGRMGFGNVQAPSDNSITPEKAALVKQLSLDPRLPEDGTVSCNSCHNLAAAGADTKPVSTGVGGAQGTRNSPTVWDAAFHQAQFWGGRACSLEEQAKRLLVNPVEMAMPSFAAVEAQVKAIPGYVAQFVQVFGKNSVAIDNIAKAIATYERTVISTQSRFYQRFSRFSDNALVAKDRLFDDQGRYIVTQQQADRHAKRVIFSWMEVHDECDFPGDYRHERCRRRRKSHDLVYGLNACALPTGNTPC